eukprot:sb/3471905/
MPVAVLNPRVSATIPLQPSPYHCASIIRRPFCPYTVDFKLKSQSCSSLDSLLNHEHHPEDEDSSCLLDDDNITLSSSCESNDSGLIGDAREIEKVIVQVFTKDTLLKSEVVPVNNGEIKTIRVVLDGSRTSQYNRYHPVCDRLEIRKLGRSCQVLSNLQISSLYLIRNRRYARLK